MQLERIKEIIAIKSNEINEAKISYEYLNEKLNKLKDSSSNYDESIKILTDVLSITQHEILSYIENVVTTALQYIYGDEYLFHVEMEIKRNQPEVSMYVTKNEIQYDFKNSCGVGILNICSFALRCVCWSLLEQQTQPVLIIDEPFSSISGSEQLEKAEYAMIKLSQLLNIQIICISGKYPVTDNYDKLYIVRMENEISRVEEVSK